MTMKLLPCPFCGGDATEETGFTDNVNKIPVYYICCQNCTAQAEGAMAWNTRAMPAALTGIGQAELDAVRIASMHNALDPYCDHLARVANTLEAMIGAVK